MSARSVQRERGPHRGAAGELPAVGRDERVEHEALAAVARHHDAGIAQVPGRAAIRHGHSDRAVRLQRARHRDPAAGADVSRHPGVGAPADASVRAAAGVDLGERRLVVAAQARRCAAVHPRHERPSVGQHVERGEAVVAGRGIRAVVVHAPHRAPRAAAVCAGAHAHVVARVLVAPRGPCRDQEPVAPPCGDRPALRIAGDAARRRVEPHRRAPVGARVRAHREPRVCALPHPRDPCERDAAPALHRERGIGGCGRCEERGRGLAHVGPRRPVRLRRARCGEQRGGTCGERRETRSGHSGLRTIRQ